MNEIIITHRDELRSLIAEEIKKLSKFESAKLPLQKEVFNSRDAMKFLGVSRSTLQRWRENGILTYRKVNGTILYTKADLLEMLENCKG